VCNAPADGGGVRRKFGWHHPNLNGLMWSGLVPCLIVVPFVRKTVVLQTPLCRRHRDRHLALTRTAIGFIVAGGALLIPLFALRLGVPAIFACLTLFFLGFTFAAIAVATAPAADGIEGRRVWIKRVAPAHLEGLPSAAKMARRKKTARKAE